MSTPFKVNPYGAVEESRQKANEIFSRAINNIVDNLIIAQEDVSSLETIITSGEITTYKHPNGDSEYVANTYDQQNGMGVYAPPASTGYTFNKIQIVAGVQTSTTTVYIEIYEVTTPPANGASGWLPTSLTLKHSTTDTWDTTYTALRTLNLTENVTIAANKSCYILFSTKTSQKVRAGKWSNNTPGNRLRYLYSVSTNYSTIFSERWWTTDTSGSYGVPPILIYDTNSLTEAQIDVLLDAKQDILSPRITMPSTIYSAVGTELNLWWDALVLGTDCGLTSPKEYSVEAICDVGSIKERCYTITPISGNIGNHTLTIKVYDSNHTLVESKTITLTVIAASAPSSVKNVLMVGDSLTASNTITITTLDGFEAIGSNIPVLWGSSGTTPNFHEGKSGWRFQDFATNTVGNPFWNSGALSISNYRTSLGMGTTKFDIVTFQLGINDCFGASKTDAEIAGIITYAKALCAAFLADNASTKIIIMLPSTDGNTKGGWGATGNYGATGYKSEYQENVWRLREAMITNFDAGAYNANVSLGIVGLVCDRYYGYAFTTANVSARYAVSENVHTNAVHPTTSGYQQMGDAIYANILKLIQ